MFHRKFADKGDNPVDNPNIPCSSNGKRKVHVLSQRGINERSPCVYVDGPRNNMDMTDRTLYLHESITDCNY